MVAIIRSEAESQQGQKAYPSSAGNFCPSEWGASGQLDDHLQHSPILNLHVGNHLPSDAVGLQAEVAHVRCSRRRLHQVELALQQ